MHVIAMAYAARVFCSTVPINRAVAAIPFVAAIFILTLYVHHTSEDWDNPNVATIAVYVGEPMMLLFIPAVAFAVDSFLDRRRRFKSWIWRIPLELLAYPVWMLFWVLHCRASSSSVGVDLTPEELSAALSCTQAAVKIQGRVRQQRPAAEFHVLPNRLQP